MSVTATIEDAPHLRRALELAQGGRGQVSPNPLVGAVVVRDGKAVGEGFHAAFGGPHAEVRALEDARANGAELEGATLVVSLEPCGHEGKTPPCTDAIVEAGIARVVIGSDDPSEHASGRGPGILRDEGIEVAFAEGELAAAARQANQPFRKHARTGRPHVTFKSAVTLDGRVATQTGDSRWISGEQARALAHRWRAECDAVCVGIGTALADDPMLTARLPEADEPSPALRVPKRVVFDSEGRLPLDSKLVQSAGEGPVIVIVSRAARRVRCEALEAAGVEVVAASGENEAARVVSGLAELGKRDVQSALLEGGPRLAGAFLDAGEVDDLCLFIAPIAVGGRSASGPVEGEGVELIGDAAHALTMGCERIGDDILISARMREW